MSVQLKFIVDECTGTRVADWLAAEGYQVYSIFDESRGMSDQAILKKAVRENWVIITNDKDFGDLIFKESQVHCGIVFMRLQNERSFNKITCLKKLLDQFLDQIANRFIVLTETNIRIIKP